MYITTTYKGTLNGVHGLWCDFCPEGVEVEEEIIVYRPDEGKVFIKDGEEYGAIVLQEGESIEDYTEVDIPEEQDTIDEN